MQLGPHLFIDREVIDGEERREPSADRERRPRSSRPGPWSTAAELEAGIRRVAVRCQTRFADAFRRLVARGYRVRWTDLRMSYEGYPERHPSAGVLFSNWEI